MGIPSTLLSFLYPPPPSIYITAMTVINFAALGNAGLKETRGKNMQYSKFSTSSSSSSAAMNKAKISSKSGMVILYTPAFLAGLFASFWMVPDEDSRFCLVSAALTIHFFKRVFEVLFVHKYSGSMDVEATIAISLSYLISTANMIYAQHLTHGFPEPQVDLKTVGAGIFLIGILGNLYHHYLLSSLRTEGEKQYKIPQGGLFNLVVCPHYLFEVLGFVGISCISQTWYAFMFTLGTTLYLMGRSVATRRWYHSKFEHFPKDRKAIIPYLF
ncbi:3-oxo-5-alpha-steroid 4-dehydrogenase 1 [Ipomoea triloba]|uniref:3-oxo-5-alpha-steroid 4-dehydrogenase 1 n=1 Tax=Ipomoea triloba TaxID=35885 RepID=UPI00125D9A2C|nr:3-oxo-5-alpha-steroid 4-dehydrogenase 1 [Ipomoea triloba]